MDNVVFTYLGEKSTTTGVMNRVKAIRAVRGLMDSTLKDAKDLIDYIQINPGTTKIIASTKNFSGVPDAAVTGFLNDLQEEGVMTSINSPINDMRMQLVDLIKEAIDADCFGLASDIASVCDKYFGVSNAYIRGGEE